MTAILILTILVAGFGWLVLSLAHQISADGYGLRPPPRSRPDEAESRELQLARLARS